MAVSANLKVSQELKEAFLAAQDGSQRYLVVRIEAEVLKLSTAHAATDDEEADFATILKNVAEHEPSLVLFHRTLADDDGRRAWSLISFVPDTSKVRQKMLYASSKKDLISKLGASLFEEDDFYVSEPADLTHENFLESGRKLTDAERQELLEASDTYVAYEDMAVGVEETIPEDAAVSAATSSSGGVPFKFEADVEEAIKAFAAGDRQVVEIKVHPKKEICQLGSLAANTSQSELEASISAEEPRFFLVNYGQKVFVYCCPEKSRVRSRMIYSTCRATVLDHAKELGAKFDKSTEMRDPEDLADCLQVAALPEATQAVKQVTKAKRQTRGKRRLNKKLSWT